MYMAPIVREQRQPSSAMARMAVGVPTLAVSVVVMLPWLAANMAVSAAVVGVLAIARGPRALAQAVSYAGQVTLGR
ncbi:hypothetical protein SAMN05192583_1561 [Sphingomonas gellani]|uniref:Uncharacterized protein n=1 Tax=Sphingomonas gellani TaxID=1166340 RepID=A0A1H8CD61_9SPHN|nr:hypothetical protein [Sphingomonas gellani]SEM93023.1 hypothetical protein SAMN05192583_1561 [Sphingomonas gellani]